MTGRSRKLRRILMVLGVVVIAYLTVAYFIAPALWRHYEHHPVMATAPRTTFNAEGMPADPLNVGLIGARAEVLHALAAAGWVPADPITARTSVGIAASVLLARPDSQAPVSPLYLFGRRQDLTFERPVGRSAKQRHHVRLWQSDSLGTNGRPLWLGGATFDRGVGFSHRTGQVTHHIAADVDAERDTLIGALASARQVETIYQVSGVGPTLFGRNGGGDPYYTDGEVKIAVLARNNVANMKDPTVLASPSVVAAKDRFWTWVRRVIRRF